MIDSPSEEALYHEGVHIGGIARTTGCYRATAPDGDQRWGEREPLMAWLISEYARKEKTDGVPS